MYWFDPLVTGNNITCHTFTLFKMLINFSAFDITINHDILRFGGRKDMKCTFSIFIVLKKAFVLFSSSEEAIVLT